MVAVEWYSDFETGEVVIEDQPLSWQIKGLQALLAKALEFGVKPADAVNTRLRFIKERVAELDRKIWGCDQWAVRLGTGPNFYLTVGDFRRRVKEQELIEKYEILTRERNSLQYEREALQEFFRPSTKKSMRLTESMIEAASNYPIEQLLEGVVKGKCLCPFHVEKTPSASIKNNRLHCFGGCRPKSGDKNSWGPISLLMEKEGLSFPAAVRRLAA